MRLALLFGFDPNAESVRTLTNTTVGTHNRAENAV